jgi:hypothetical protein
MACTACAIGSRLFGLGSDRVTLRVPADHAAALAEALLHLYQAKAESLRQRVNDLIRGEGSAEAVAQSRSELQALDQAIEQLGWDAGARDGDLDVTAERAVLREATMVAIDDAGERLSGLCTALLRGEAAPAEVSGQVDAVGGLLELLHAAGGD